MLNNIVGQTKAKKILDLKIKAFRKSGRKIPHIGFFGPSGNGKTALAKAFAEEIGAELIYINATSIKDPIQFRSFFEQANQMHGTYLVFIDECHALPRKIQDNLLSVLEEPAVLCTIAPRTMNVYYPDGTMDYHEKGSLIMEKLPENMSFVFATTDKGKMRDTILNRLTGIALEDYGTEEYSEIAKQYMETSGYSISESLIRQIANRARSVRQMLKMLCANLIDIKEAYGTFDIRMLDDLLGLDPDGANELDRQYLSFLAKHHRSGVDNIANQLRVDKKEVIEKIEPFLLRKGWIKISRIGRELTASGRSKGRT